MSTQKQLSVRSGSMMNNTKNIQLPPLLNPKTLISDSSLMMATNNNIPNEAGARGTNAEISGVVNAPLTSSKPSSPQETNLGAVKKNTTSSTNNARLRTASILSGDSSIFSASTGKLFTKDHPQSTNQQRARLLSLKRADPFEQIARHVEEIIYFIEMGVCPPAKKVPTAFANAVVEAREKELWSFPTGRDRDVNGNKRWLRRLNEEGEYELLHESDEAPEVPQYPISVPIANDVLTAQNHPALIALRENNMLAKRKKAPPKKLPGAEFMTPTGTAVGQGDMNWDGVLRCVCLAQLGIGASLCKRVGRAMILNTSVLTLDVSECNMTDAGCIELCDCLARNNGTLKVLNISGNYLTEACAVAIANLVRSPRSKITTLFAACNRLGNETAIEISKALLEQDTLEFLNLRGNCIDDAGAAALLLGASAVIASSTEGSMNNNNNNSNNNDSNNNNSNGKAYYEAWKERDGPWKNKKLSALWLQLNLISDEMMAELNALMEKKCPKAISRAMEPKKKKKKGGPAKGGQNGSSMMMKSSMTSVGEGTVSTSRTGTAQTNDANKGANSSVRSASKRSRSVRRR